MRVSDLERNNKINLLYFKDKLTLTSISEIVDISIGQISRILAQNQDYQTEKYKRIEENHIKNSEQTKAIMKAKREKQKHEDQILKIMHNQATAELSYRKSITNTNVRKSCSSVYINNSSKKQFELDKNLAYSKDMPKIIKY